MQIAKMQTWALRAGFTWLAVSVVMTAAAGWSFGEGHIAKQILFMFGFPLITIAAATLLPFLELALEKRAFAVALLIASAWGFCTAGEGFGHVMIIASQRDHSIQGASLKDAAWDQKNTAVAELKTKLDLLEENHKRLTKDGSFSTTVTAESLDKRIESADAFIKLEAERGGCKSKCEARMREKDTLVAQKAAIETFNKSAAQLTATKEALDKTRLELASMDKGHSDARSQQNVISQILNASLTPDETQKSRAGLILELFFVACFLFGPMTLIAVGVRDWNKPKRAKFDMLRDWMARVRAWFNTEPLPQTRYVDRVVEKHKIVGGTVLTRSPLNGGLIARQVNPNEVTA